MVAGAGFLSASTSTPTLESDSATATAVAVQGLTVKLIQRKLLDDISVDFTGKRITAIVGPTGCGKTTLLRSVNRMHDHTMNMSVEGAITFAARSGCSFSGRILFRRASRTTSPSLRARTG
jgi:ABC-type phosphate transport system ATPase subunit